MISDKLNRSFFNLIAMMAKSFIVMIIGFISVPYLLEWLGKERLGAYRLLIDWTTNISFLELGVGGAMVPFFCSAWSRRSASQLYSGILTGFWAYAKTLPIIFIACFLLYFNLNNVIAVQASMYHELSIAYMILVVGFLLLPFTVFQVYYETIEKTFVTSIVIFLQLILVTSLALFFAYRGHGLIGQAYAFSIGLLFLHGTLWLLVQKKHRKITLDLLRLKVDREISARIWKINWSNFAVNLSRQLSLYVDNIIIGIFFSPTIVVSFFITVKLPLVIMSLLQNFGGAVWASLVSFYHSGEKELFNKRLIESSKIISIVSTSAMLPIFLFNENFISLWVGPDNYLGKEVTSLALFVSFFQGLNFFWGRVFVGTGHVKRQVFPSTFAAGINLVFSLVLTWQVGVCGPVWGTVISFILFNFWYQLHLLAKIYGTSLLTLVKSILTPIACAIILAIIIQKWIPKVESITILIGMMALFSLAFLLFSYAFLLDKREKSLWWQRIRSRLSR